MASPMTNLMISLGAMQLARKIPFEDPEVLNYVRVGYVSAQLIILAVYYFVSMKIKQKNDQTVLKYVENAPLTGGSGGLVTKTVRDYDLSETSKAVRGVYLGIAMMGFLHVYMKYTQPLFIQALMGIKALYDSKIVAIHVLGKPADGDLKRPFKAGPSLFGASADPKTDKASIEEAEKKIGSKKDE